MDEGVPASEAGARLISKVPQVPIGELRELEAALLLPASDAGSFFTWPIIPVDGGALLSMS